jgi:type IV pilus assembly protein PilO
MTLDELRRLNPRDIGSWPVLPKLGALLLLIILIMVAGYWFDWANQWDELTAARAKESSLRDQFLDKKRQAINLEAYRKQLADIEQSFGAMLKQLPNKSEMEALLSDINQAGLGRGLQFELFKPAAQEVMSDFYAELPITIKLAGPDVDSSASVAGVRPRLLISASYSLRRAKMARASCGSGRLMRGKKTAALLLTLPTSTSMPFFASSFVPHFEGGSIKRKARRFSQ